MIIVLIVFFLTRSLFDSILLIESSGRHYSVDRVLC